MSRLKPDFSCVNKLCNPLCVHNWGNTQKYMYVIYTGFAKRGLPHTFNSVVKVNCMHTYMYLNLKPITPFSTGVLPNLVCGRFLFAPNYFASHNCIVRSLCQQLKYLPDLFGLIVITVTILLYVCIKPNL